jgi:hypothetical protein
MVKEAAMTDQKPDQEKQITPQGAVEVDEKDLDQAAGGSEYITLNYSKMVTEYEAPKSTDGSGPHVLAPPDDGLTKRT